ncbi:MAG: ATP-binding protein [Chloroflexi bacterium]|nr:ATP-binding protein [Chloroflexota bacterium]
MTIRVLTPETAAKIAAGEVVERPASVVKELVENALDAGASAIAVEVSGGGQELIRVTDDGCGLAAEELELAFARHATSKLTGDDLLSITTLGFRGEALPAIAAMAEVEMVSRPADAQSAAYVRLDGGAVVERGERGAPAGTSVSVSQLFARQPARRKFLRSPSTEANHIASVVSHYALAYPAVRFSLTLEGRQSLLTDGNGELRDAIAAVYGADVAAAILKPFVSEQNLWMVQMHGIFQGYYFWHHLDEDRNAREKYRDHPHYDHAAEFCALYDQCSFDPAYDTQPVEHFEPLVRRVLAQSRWDEYQD